MVIEPLTSMAFCLLGCIRPSKVHAAAAWRKFCCNNDGDDL